MRPSASYCIRHSPQSQSPLALPASVPHRTSSSAAHQRTSQNHRQRPCAVCRPEQVVDHSLAQREAEGQRGRQLLFCNSVTVFLHGKGVDFELIFQQSGCRAAEAEEVIAGHGGVSGVGLAGKSPDGAAGVSLIHTVSGDGIQQRPYPDKWMRYFP